MFPRIENVETPLGPADEVWATSEAHIGMRGTFTVNRVEYRVRLDLQYRDGAWQRGHTEGDWSSHYHALIASRTDYKGDASASARTKLLAALEPWLAAYAEGEGREMVRQAGAEDRARAIESKRAAIEKLRAELGTAERELDELTD